MPDMPTQCTGVGWADLDRDGDLDLCVGRQGGSGSTYYVNDGSQLLDGGGFDEGTGVAWGDYDNDRWPDLYVANRATGTSQLFHNVSGTFVEVTTATLSNVSGRGYHAEWVDYDNDGDLDLYVGNTTIFPGVTSRLYRNTNLTAAGFVDVTAASGIVADRGTGAWGDFDNDGLQDLYTRHSTGNRLWRNIGSGTFSDVTSAPLNLVANGGMAWGDYDADGYLDLAVSDSAVTTKLFHNDAGTNKWLQVDLLGVWRTDSALARASRCRRAPCGRCAKSRPAPGTSARTRSPQTSDSASLSRSIRSSSRGRADSARSSHRRWSIAGSR